MANHSIHSKTKGSLMENEDWWALSVNDDTGEASIVHTWHHMNPYNSKVISEGSSNLTIDEFLKSNQPKEAKEKLQALIKEHGINA